MLIFELFGILSSVEETIRFLMRKGILPSSKRCPGCGIEMKLCSLTRNRNIPYKFKCIKKICGKTLSLTSGTFFENLKMDIRNYLWVIFQLCYKTSYKTIKKQLNICDKTISEIYNKISIYFSNDLLNTENTFKIGGLLNPVEIDETYYGRNFKIIGAFEHNTKRIFIKIVNSVNIESVDIFIRSILLPDTLLITDSAPIYTNIINRLPNLIRRHELVNHSIREFKNINGYSTNNIENIWNQLKFFCKTPGDHSHLALLIDIFIFVYNNKMESDQLFDWILEKIKV